MTNREGERIGTLTVLGHAGTNKHRKALWTCLCDCGKTVTLPSNVLGNREFCSNSCPLATVFTKHGMYNTYDYIAWRNMKARCTNPKHKSYKRYGGRDITVCPHWDTFEGFFEDMGLRPKDHPEEGPFILNRRDNDLGYFKSNCHWATQREQANNRSTNNMKTLNGKTRTMTQWCRYYNTSYHLVKDRLKRGWDLERALVAPITKKSTAASDDFRRTPSYRKWRAAVIRRDTRCAVCSSIKNRQAHHKNGAKYFKEQRYDVDNGITLCRDCHIEFHCDYKNSYREKCTEKDFMNFQALMCYAMALGAAQIVHEGREEADTMESMINNMNNIGSSFMQDMGPVDDFEAQGLL